MNFQLIAALLLLAGAAFFLGRRTYKSFAGKGNHSSCADCSTIEKVKEDKVSG